MIDEIVLRVALTAAYALACGFHLVRLRRDGGLVDRVGSVLHALMCAGMVLMAWPATMAFAPVPQTALFAVAAAWFAALAAIGGRACAGHGRVELAHHAVMMAGMAWMVVVMPLAMREPSSGGGGGAHDHHGGATTTAVDAGAGAPGHVTAVGLALAALFAVAGTAWLARALDVGRAPGARRRAVAPAVESAMSLGMAVMAVAMT
ncbi:MULTISPECIES: DUF5134 domain-containing protein [Actinosynnema]|uniref:DUF5134 domain-containing protein n=1 Tax=Actinosynnema pretiosum TaxID=42197 RepID=A0A290Z501_9PSEU|nr:DUF5134 domain-containing protein [Actinosynnema pretiosum]ATE54121.1 DUF5134 domain-containing protein [Actinosynnema pretiosum]